MVGIGEFSPNNPKLYKEGKPPLGLGEYEEARKILLEQHRKEKRANDKKVKKKTKREDASKKKQKVEETDRGKADSGGDTNDESDREASMAEEEEDSTIDKKAEEQRMIQDMPNSFPHNNHSILPTHPECSEQDAEMLEEMKRWEQERYKEELDEQIREKERLRREEEENELREEEERERILQEQTKKLREEYERELNSRRLFVWQRRKRAEMLKQRLEQLQQENEERKRLRRAERLRLRPVLSQNNIPEDLLNLGERDRERSRYKARSLSPSLLSYPVPRNLYPHNVGSLYHCFSPPITPRATHRRGTETLIIDAPHDLSVTPAVEFSSSLVDPNAVPLPLPKVHHRSRRLQEMDVAKSYKQVGETTLPYGFHRSKRILTQLGQFRKQLQFGNKFNKI